MENKINNNCDGRGCRVYIRPFDRRVNPVFAEMYAKRYDFQKMVSFAYLFLDKVVEKERQMEKKFS